MLTDDELLADGAFDALILRHRDRLLRYVHHWTGPRYGYLDDVVFQEWAARLPTAERLVGIKARPWLYWLFYCTMGDVLRAEQVRLGL